MVETALGYFINPLVLVLLGVLCRRAAAPCSGLAVGVGGLAVVVLTVDYGRLPYIALLLAASFGFYGLVKKRWRPRRPRACSSSPVVCGAGAGRTWPG